MTVIAAYKGKDGKVVVGSDSMAYHESNCIRNLRKITKFNHFYVGCAGEYKVHHILEELAASEYFSPILTIADARSFTKKVMEVLKTDCEYDEVEDLKDSALLIATPNSIFEVDSNFVCLEHSDVAAIGTGSTAAKAAMKAVVNQQLSNRDVLAIGIDSSCYFDVYCGLPMYIYEVENEPVKKIKAPRVLKNKKEEKKNSKSKEVKTPKKKKKNT